MFKHSEKKRGRTLLWNTPRWNIDDVVVQLYDTAVLEVGKCYGGFDTETPPHVIRLIGRTVHYVPKEVIVSAERSIVYFGKYIMELVFGNKLLESITAEDSKFKFNEKSLIIIGNFRDYTSKGLGICLKSNKDYAVLFENENGYLLHIPVVTNHYYYEIPCPTTGGVRRTKRRKLRVKGLRKTKRRTTQHK